MGEVIDLGVQNGLVDKAGAWYAYNGDKIGQGKANAARYLEEHPEAAQAIEAALREKLLAVQVNEKKKVEAEDGQLDL
jgi:recombination protein RecA